jgi:hypothetical protein
VFSISIPFLFLGAAISRVTIGRSIDDDIRFYGGVVFVLTVIGAIS